MREVFQMILTMSAQGAVLVVIALFARLLLRRSPANFRYLLWMLVLARLLVPVQLPSPVSLFNLLPETREAVMFLEQDSLPTSAAAQTIQPEPITTSPPAVSAYEDMQDGFSAPTLTHSPATSAQQPGSMILAQKPFSLQAVLSTIWLCGTILLALMMCAVYAIAYCRIGRRADENGVAMARGIQRPFVIGLFRPLIALPRWLDAQSLRYVLRHERAHIQRLDHLFRLLMMAALCVHWFNPMAWIAARWMSIDCEAACDERATKGLSPLERRQYAKALLDVAEVKGTMLLPVLAFSGGGLKGRIQRILSGKKAPLISVVAAGILLLSLAAVGLTAAWPMEEAVSSDLSPAPTIHASSATPPATPAPSASPLPIRAESEYIRSIPWQGEVPTFPADDISWSYRREPEDILNIDDTAERIWGDAKFKLEQGDGYGTVYSLQVAKESTEMLYQDEDPSYLSFSRSRYTASKEPVSMDMQHIEEMGRTVCGWFGLSMDDYLYQPTSARGWETYADVFWQQMLNGYAVSGGTLQIGYDSNTMQAASCKRQNLQPVGDRAQFAPLSLREALYTVEYWLSRMDDPSLDREKQLNLTSFYSLSNLGELSSVQILYSDVFEPSGKLFAPVWRLDFSRDIDGEPMVRRLYVDPITGDLYTDENECYHSPYPERGATPRIAANQERKHAFIRDMDALFPLVFARQDGYTYYVMPPENSGAPASYGARIYKRDDTTGQEMLLSDCAYYDTWESIDIQTLHSALFAALVEDRIVFRGFEDTMDYKAGGVLLSIDLTGGDLQVFRATYNSLSNLCADNGLIYYTGWPGNDRDSYPLNYVDPLFERNRNVYKGESRPFAMRDGVAYALAPDASPDNIVYRWQGDGWSEHISAPFVIQSARYLIGQDGWILRGEDGESMLFTP